MDSRQVHYIRPGPAPLMGLPHASKERPIKRLPWCFFCGVAALSLLAGTAAIALSQGGPFTLTLQAPKQQLKAGQPLILSVIVKNASHRPIHVLVSQGAYDVGNVYHLHVLDKQGLPPRRASLPKPRGGKGSVVIVGSVHGTRLQPDESLTDEVNISHIYDLTRPGKYRISIAEPFFRGPDVPNGLVRSNTITVTVIK